MTTAGLADVGGSLGTYNAGGNATTFHGKTGFKREFDGMRVENMEADGNLGYILNAITVQETTVETGGVSAESDMSGVSMNMIPKEGGNAFRFMASGLFTNEHLSTDNFGDNLRARGVTLPSKVINIYDWWGTVGGPIKQDKLWFFAAERIWGNRNQRANTFWNGTQGTPFYTPDAARPFQPNEYYKSHAARVGVSYITGTHTFKGGFQLGQGVKNLHQYSWSDYNYTFLRGVPTQITQLATPYLRKERIRADLGLYAQDQWAVKRLNVNYGLRFDYYNAYVPEQHMPATKFVPARDFEPVYHVPLWKDVSPRLGVAYDLFGNGRTVVKASLGRYVGKTANCVAADNNPVTRPVLSATRTC